MYLFIFTSCPATLLQQFRQELSALYSSYMKGEALKEYGLSQENQQGFIYKYVSQHSDFDFYIAIIKSHIWTNYTSIAVRDSQYVYKYVEH